MASIVLQKPVSGVPVGHFLESGRKKVRILFFALMKLVVIQPLTYRTDKIHPTWLCLKGPFLVPYLGSISKPFATVSVLLSMVGLIYVFYPRPNH